MSVSFLCARIVRVFVCVCVVAGVKHVSCFSIVRSQCLVCVSWPKLTHRGAQMSIRLTMYRTAKLTSLDREHA